MKRVTWTGYLLCAATTFAARPAVALPKEPPDLPTIDGPETTSLIKELRGQLVRPKPTGGVLSALLPSLEQITLRPPEKYSPIKELSGVDRAGRVVVVETAGNQLTLRLVTPDDKLGKEIVKRADTGFQSRAIGRPVLSPTGSLIAFVSKTRSLWLEGKLKLTYRDGELEVWSAEKKERVQTQVRALDRSLAWLADGKELIFSALVRPDTLPDSLVEDYSRVTGSGLLPVVEDKVPVVYRMEVPGRKFAALCIGRRSVVSIAGDALLVEGIGYMWMRYDLKSKTLTAVKLPGVYDDGSTGVYEGGAIGLHGDLVVYWGLPTTGSEQRTTTGNSPFTGSKQMPSIKVARPSTGHFQTIIPYMDPRYANYYCDVSVSK